MLPRCLQLICSSDLSRFAKPSRAAFAAFDSLSRRRKEFGWRFAKGWLWRHESGVLSVSPQPAPSCSPDEMPNLMPDKGWRRHFEEPIPLPDEMAAKAAQGYYHDFLSPLDLPELELDASPDAGASWPDFGNSSPAG